MIRLSDLKVISTQPDADCTLWILWHEDAGAFLLKIAAIAGRPHAVISGADAGPTWDYTHGFSRKVGSSVLLHSEEQIVFQAPLDFNPPAKGPDLFAACMAALKRQYEPSPLKLRTGRSEASLAALIKAVAQLISHRDGRVHLAGINCAWEPVKPIKAWHDRAKEISEVDDSVIVGDIGEWFAPCSKNGIADLDGQADGRPLPAVYVLPSSGTPSSHELIEAAATIARFYEEAGDALGLDAGAIGDRLAFLGISAE